MKSGKVAGPGDTPVEVWRGPGERAVDFLTRLLEECMRDGEKV